LVKEILKTDVIPIVNVSIDGGNQLPDRLRGMNGAYKRSIETFNALRKFKKGNYYVSCTLSKFNIDYIDDLLIGLKRNIPGFRLSNLHFNIFHNSSVYYNNQGIDGISGMHSDLVIKYLNLVKAGNLLKFFLENEYINGVRCYLCDKRAPLRCQAMNASCFINPAGKVFSCSIYNEKVGDLRDYDYDLQALWNSSRSFIVRKNIDDGKCPSCWTPCEAYPAILGSILSNDRGNRCNAP
jgi:MoaA/NifB/PqqE/SkfB family radical SAM enzyme